MMNADMAIRVGLVTRTTPESWMAAQVKWDFGRRPGRRARR